MAREQTVVRVPAPARQRPRRRPKKGPRQRLVAAGPPRLVERAALARGGELLRRGAVQLVMVQLVAGPQKVTGPA